MEKEVGFNDILSLEEKEKSEDDKAIEEVVFDFKEDVFDEGVVKGYVDSVIKLLLMKDFNFFNLDVETAYEEYYNILKEKYKKVDDFDNLLEFFEFFNPNNFEYIDVSDEKVILKFNKELKKEFDEELNDEFNKENEFYKNNRILFKGIYKKFIENMKFGCNNLREVEVEAYYLFLKIRQFFKVFLFDRERVARIKKEIKGEKILLACKGSFYEQFYWLDEENGRCTNFDTDKDDLVSFEQMTEYYDGIIPFGCSEVLDFLKNYPIKESLISNRHFKNKEIKDLNFGECVLEIFIKYSDLILNEAYDKLHEYGEDGDNRFKALKKVVNIMRGNMVVLKKIDKNNNICAINLKLIKNRFLKDVLKRVKLLYIFNPICLTNLSIEDRMTGEYLYRFGRLFCLYFSKIIYFISCLNIFPTDFYDAYEKLVLE